MLALFLGEVVFRNGGWGCSVNLTQFTKHNVCQNVIESHGGSFLGKDPVGLKGVFTAASEGLA